MRLALNVAREGLAPNRFCEGFILNASGEGLDRNKGPQPLKSGARKFPIRP
jgi:hypothetical protein